MVGFGMLWRKTSAALATAVLCAASPLATAASAEASNDPTIARALELTNTERHRNGLAPLALSPELGQAAQEYSAVLATTGCFAHDCGPVPNMADRIGRAGYTGWTAIAENIAAGYPTPEAVLDGWMTSPGHRANILSPRYTEIGIGLAKTDGRYKMFWTQNFGRRPELGVPRPEPEAGYVYEYVEIDSQAEVASEEAE
jgi:uncharacterized protein YkwD